MTAPHNSNSERVLVLAPFGRDARLIAGLLAEAAVPAFIVDGLPALQRGLEEMAGAVVLTEEAVASADLNALHAWLTRQPTWSDMPFVVLVRQGGGPERNLVAARLSGVLGNVSFVERPFHPTTLVSLVRTALRARRRQYEARARLEALRVSEEHYRTLFEAIDSGFCTIEILFDGDRAVDYRFLEVNPAFVAQTGLVDAAGRRMRDLAPAHEQHWFDIYGRVARTGVPARFESAAEALGRWYDVHAFRVGRPEDLQVAILFNDISTRRRVELALAASERELRLVADMLPVLVSFVDRDLVYRFANAAYPDWFGLAPEAVVGRRIPDLVTDEGYQTRRPLIERALAGEAAQAFLDWPKPDGQRRIADVRYTPRRDAEGEVDGFYIFVQDVTVQQDAAAALASRAETLSREVAERTAERDQVWQASTDLLCVASLDGRLISLNPAWSATLGWDEAELRARPFLDFVHPDDLEATRAMMSRLAAGEAVLVFENRYRHRDGTWHWLSWNAVPRGGLVYANVRDVTAPKQQAISLAQAEEALRQSQKMEAVGQLTGGVAHDFNNLLTIIRSSVDFLRRRDLSEERQRRYIDAVSDTVDRAAKLTGQLLAFARRQALKPEVFEVGARLRGVADMIDTVTGARIRVVTDLPDEPCHVQADVSQFETALINMAVNARDAMDGEGVLTLGLIGRAPLPSIRGHAGSESAFVAISLADTGSGIPPDLINRIFEPFFTTKEVGKGTGLGLSQVFGFAKQSGGDVDVASEPDRGTTFMLYLPQVAVAASEIVEDEGEAEPVPRGAGRRILVVEDNLEVGAFATQTLEDLGYVTTWAKNGEEALAMLESDGVFDVVFSDVVMPGMGGIALAEEVRRRWPRLPVVLASGYSHVLAEQGTHGFELLHKPYSVEQLSRVLWQVSQRSAKRTARLPRS